MNAPMPPQEWVEVDRSYFFSDLTYPNFNKLNAKNYVKYLNARKKADRDVDAMLKKTESPEVKKKGGR